MQAQEPELNFQQLKRDVNLADLAVTLGYEHNTRKSGHSIEKGKFHVFDYKGNGALDRVVIYKAPGGDWLYFNPQDDRDKGSVIDFVKFRVENPKIAAVTATPGKSAWYDVIENCRRFLNLPAPQREHPQLQKQFTPITPGAGFNIQLDKCRPLDNATFLHQRGLTDATLNAPLFKGRILNQVNEGVSKKYNQPYRFDNVAFPQYYKDKVVGLEVKNHNFKGQAADSLNSSALWLSNTPDKLKVFMLTESGVDALSHYQLHTPANTLYGSTSGNLTDNKLFEVKRLVQDHNIPTVRLGLDNNVQGHIYDTKVLAALAHEANPTSILRNQPSLITVGIHAADPKPIIDLVRAVKTYNQGVTESYHQAAGTQAASNTLNSSLISSNKEGQNTYQFHIPKENGALAAFNQALLRALPLSVKVEITKSRTDDWNNDLKASLRASSAQQHVSQGQSKQQPEPPEKAVVKSKGQRM